MPGQECVPKTPPLDLAAFARERGEELVAALVPACWGGLDATDVAQEALTIAYAKFSTGSEALPDRLFPYVVGIGRNVARSQRGEERRADEAHREIATATARRPRRDLSDIAAENADLARAFGSLRPQHRKALLLASDGFDLDSIASLLDLPTRDAAKQLLYRARCEIKDALGPAAPCLALPWWSWWRRWTTGRAADSAASVAETAVPAAGPAAQSAAVMSAAVALSLVAALVPGDAGRALTDQTVPAAQAPSGAPAPVLPSTVRAAGTPARPDVTNPDGMPVGPYAPDPSSEPRIPMVNGVPVPVPTRQVPTACAPTPSERDCVPQEGDTIAVGDIKVTEPLVPICHRVPTVPLVTCTRQEPDRWTVKDVPPVYSGGTQ